MSDKSSVSLKEYNTFAIDAFAKDFIKIESVEDLDQWNKSHQDVDFLILGQGSNILFSKDPEFFILKNELKGIEIKEVDKNEVKVVVGSGENWHDFVSWAVQQNFGAIENLALIPGSVGAAPVQNIGAYGKEVSQVIEELSYYDLKDREIHTLKAQQCNFGYRDSIFKHALQQRAFILNVTFRLTNKDHNYVLDYGPLKSSFENKVLSDISIKDIYEKIIEIRMSKLPDPAVLGNGGSFFKNPIVSCQIEAQLKIAFPNLVSFKVDENNSKLAAGWLIDQAGWKGKRVGDAGCHDKQALVLVNHGNATGKDILHLSSLIKNAVYAKFGVVLEEEVIVV